MRNASKWSSSGTIVIPCSSASIRESSSALSSKSKTARFSAIRAGRTDFGMTWRPSCERLLTAGRELFARHGLGVTLNDVAHHAGVGVGTADRRFSN